MKIMVGFRATRAFKKFLQDMAKRENRTLSNFIVNALLTYIKEHHDVTWLEKDKK
jgi:uncharacterized protein (DUF1778 family)